MSDRQILSGTLRITAFVVIAKIVIAAREMTLAWQYGMGPVADAYNVAIALGTWLPILLAAAIGSALVPALVRARARGSEEESWFVGELDGHFLLLALITSAFGFGLAVFAPPFLDLSSDASRQLAHELLLYFAPFAGLTTIFYYLSNRLQARGSFVYTVLEALPAVLVMGGIMVLPISASATALGGGTLIGGVLQIGALHILLLRMRAPGARPSLRREAPEWRVLLTGVGIMTAGQAILSLSAPIDQFFAVRAGPGVPASLGYASRLIGLGTSVGTLVLARALLPALATMRSHDPEATRRTVIRWAVYTFAAGLVAAVTAFFLALPVTRLVFERGSFTDQDARQVAYLLQLGALQLPFYFSSIAIVQWLAVESRFTAIAAIAVATFLVKLLFLLTFVTRYGATALMLSTVGMYVFAWMLQLITIARARATDGPTGAAAL